MSDIQIFRNPQFGEIRTLADEAGEPLFCAADLCRALGYSNPRKAIADHVDEGDVTKRDTPTASGVQNMTFVNESGMYSLIFGSRLDSAKAFKRWVTSVVLPAIRKTGAYIGPKAESTEAMLVQAVLRSQSQIERLVGAVEKLVERVSGQLSANSPEADERRTRVHSKEIREMLRQMEPGETISFDVPTRSAVTARKMMVYRLQEQLHCKFRISKDYVNCRVTITKKEQS